ncbi:tryptophan-rich sensory protein [Bacillus lacus]|uniref:Tryptophan-rich sensory protein n=1 Tax=Metabacillus lacus TaxID=1983721 RepID=A0A7X2J063_9BACI|nr:tryptophan-rich sensory protein [Metabacillus lacus]MRX73023.1 tryptophan-rich sensory protein [Metabacillus lacus]
MKKDLWIKAANIGGFLFIIYISFFSSQGEDLRQDETQETIFTPAPYAFSIWGLIYLLILIWIIKMFTAKEHDLRAYRRVGWLVPISLVISALSLTVSTTAAIFFITGALIVLMVIYTTIQRAENTTIFFRVPFSFFIAWMSVAAIVDMFIVLEHNNINQILGLGELAWASIMIGVGGVIALFFMHAHDDIIFPAVFIWGYIALIVNQHHLAVIVITAGTMSAVLAAAIGWKLLKRFKGERI